MHRKVLNLALNDYDAFVQATGEKLNNGRLMIIKSGKATIIQRSPTIILVSQNIRSNEYYILLRPGSSRINGRVLLLDKA